jgi:hypothetical protein
MVNNLPAVNHGKMGESAMKTALSAAFTGAILLAATAGLSQPVSQPAAFGSLQVKGISMVEIDTNHVRVSVNLALVPSQSATLKDLRLCSLRLNGLPVFASPLDQEIVLKKDVSTALPPLYITAMFRDLNTVQPLQKMVEKQSVHLQGELMAAVQLTFMEKLALHTQHPEVAIALSQDVPAQIGSSPFERTMALGILSVIDAGLQTNAGKNVLGVTPAWVGDLDKLAQTDLFQVESSYALTQGDASYPVLSDRLGFLVASGKVVTTAEALEPWRYDSEFLGAVKSGGVKLVKNSREIQLLPLVPNASILKQSAKDFTVEARGNPEENPITAVSPSYGEVVVLRRAAPSSIAVISLHQAAPQPGLAVAPAAVAARDSWEQVAVFRLRLDSETRKVRSVEVLQLGAKREGKGIALTEPVDSEVFGSPIVTPDGVIGVVQDEQSGAFLPADLSTPATPVPQSAGQGR